MLQPVAVALQRPPFGVDWQSGLLGSIAAQGMKRSGLPFMQGYNDLNDKSDLK